MRWIPSLPLPLRALLTIGLLSPSLVIHQVLAFDLPALVLPSLALWLGPLAAVTWVIVVICGLWVIWIGADHP